MTTSGVSASMAQSATELPEDVASTPAATSVARARKRKTGSGPSGRLHPVAIVGLRLVVPLLIVVGWWLMSLLPTIGLFIPTPGEAVARFWEDFVLGGATVNHLLPSLQRAVIGLFLAIVLGIAIGVLLGMSSILTGLFQPLIHLGRSLPSPALLGVFFFLFGTGDAPKIFLITFSVIWPILLNTIDGVGSVGELRSQAAQVFRVPSHRVLSHIVLPGAAPKIFAGIRTSMSYSLILMIISELQKSENGLGYLLIRAQRNFDFPGFFAVLIVLVIVGVVFNSVFLFVERRVLAWHRGVTQQND